MDIFNKTLDMLGIRDLDYEVEKNAKGYRIFTSELKEIPMTPNDSYGLFAIRANGKPTSFFVRAFHKRVKNRVNVNTKELEMLLNGEALDKPGHGWCLICWDGVPIGTGTYTREGLKLEMPKDDIMRARAGFKRILQK